MVADTNTAPTSEGPTEPILGVLAQRRDGQWEWQYLSIIARSKSKQRVLAYAHAHYLGEQGALHHDAINGARAKYPYEDTDGLLVRRNIVPPVRRTREGAAVNV
jgi:hypothetical protein